MGIVVEHLSHIYSEGLPDQQVALNDVSFTIEDGEFAGIIGHTGSGKSTLLQHLNGLIKPKEGRIIIDGTDITEPGVSLIEIRKKIGLVFQYPEYQLFDETVALDVAFGPKNLGLSGEELDARVREAIELVGLDYEAVKDKSPFDLSGGQKRRAAIAGVIAMHPEVLILDEPTAGLDPKAHRDVIEMMKRIHCARNTIIILVSHNMSDIANLCDKVIVMDSGRLVLTGTPKEVFSDARRLEAIGLSLPPAAQLLHTVSAGGADVASGIFSAEGAAEEIAAFLERKAAR